MELKIFNLQGEVVGQERLTEVLGPVNRGVLYQAVNAYLANQRQGNASAKNRSEVSGGGKKPWRQKGTGRARVGSIRSPLWRKGGVVFGPSKNRSYYIPLPKKIRETALKEALKDKLLEKRVFLLAEAEVSEPKTKAIAKFLQKASLSGKILLFLPEESEFFRRAGRNIPGLVFANWKALNCYQVINADFLLVYKDIWQELKKRLVV